MQFYSDITDYLINHYCNFINVTLIVPTYFDTFLLKKSILSKLDASCFLPKIYELDQFISEVSHIQNLNIQELIFLLHEVYQENCEKINIVKFYNFGIKLLEDFELLNKYLIDLEQYQEGDILGNFCSFSEIKKLYNIFCLKLKKLNLEGKALGLKEFFYADFKFIEEGKKILILGFDDFLPIESYWIDHLQSMCEVKKFSPSTCEKEKNNNSKVYCIKSSTIYGQIVYVSNKIKQLTKDYMHVNCNIIVSSSEILSSLLQTLNDKSQEANLLINYSFLGTKVCLACKAFINFYRVLKNRIDFVSAASLSEIIKYCPFWSDKFKRLKEFIDTHYFDYISIDSIKDLLDHSLYDLLFPSLLQTFFDYIKIVFTSIYSSLNGVLDYLEISSCLALLRVIDEYFEYYNLYALDDLISIFELRLDTISFVVERFNNSNISILGLENLLALGESNSSKHRVLFFINANEEFNIPSFESFNYLDIDNISGRFTLQDKIQYMKIVRAIDNAEEVYCLFNSSTGELNRHILRFCYTSEQEFAYLSIASNSSESFTKKIEIKKNKYILEHLNAYNSSIRNHKCFSVTQINTYLNCSLQFYFKYLSNIKIIDHKPTDQQIFGTILHRVLAQVYRELSFNNKLFSRKTFIGTKELGERVIEDFFKDFFLQKTGGDFGLNGEQLILMDIMKNMVSKFLYIDSSGDPFELVSLEERYECELALQVKNNFAITLFGVFDRVDIQSGAYRITDYKMGNFNEKILSVENLFSHCEKLRNPIALQLIVYSYILLKKLDNPKLRVYPQVISFKNLFTKNIINRFCINGEKGSEELIDILDYVYTIEKCLVRTISEIYSKEYVFCQTEDIEVCNSCIFTNICQR